MTSMHISIVGMDAPAARVPMHGSELLQYDSHVRSGVIRLHLHQEGRRAGTHHTPSFLPSLTRERTAIRGEWKPTVDGGPVCSYCSGSVTDWPALSVMYEIVWPPYVSVVYPEVLLTASPVTGTVAACCAVMVIVGFDDAEGGTMLAVTPAALYFIRPAIVWPRTSIFGLRMGTV